MEELITGDGRIFKPTLKGTYQEIGGKNAEVSPKTLKEYGDYTGVKVERLTDVAKTHPQFAQMMYDKAKNT